MKEPKIIAEYQCDGMCCTRFRIELVSIESANARDLATIAEAAGCGFLGRATFFCPDCASGRRGRPTFCGPAESPTGAKSALAGVTDLPSAPGECPGPRANLSTGGHA